MGCRSSFLVQHCDAETFSHSKELTPKSITKHKESKSDPIRCLPEMHIAKKDIFVD